MKERSVKIVTFLIGLYYILEFVLPAQIAGHKTYLSNFLTPVGDFVAIIWAFSMGLGAVNLSITHGKKIKKGAPGWIYSLAFFISMFAMMVALYLKTYHPTDIAKKFFNLIFMRMYMPLGATIFSLLALYMVSAAYRAFKIKTFEASVMVIAAVIVMLGQVPVGLWLTHALPGSLQLPRLSAWILYIANTAAYRAVRFGVFIGMIAISLRIWLSLERVMFGGGR